MADDLNKRSVILSALKVFEVLELLAAQNPASLTEIAKMSGFSKSNTQRILNTLCAASYIRQDEESLKYVPTIKLYSLGSTILRQDSIRLAAHPYLLKLQQQFNETVNLGILDRDSILYLDKIVSKSPLRVELELGSKVPVYCSGLGKAISAFHKIAPMPDNFTRYTENTVSSQAEFEEQLAKIRKQGYALDAEEYVEGLVCIAVPILHKQTEPVAAVSISIPNIRFQESNVPNYVSALQDCAQGLAEALH